MKPSNNPYQTANGSDYSVNPAKEGLATHSLSVPSTRDGVVRTRYQDGTGNIIAQGIFSEEQLTHFTDNYYNADGRGNDNTAQMGRDRWLQQMSWDPPQARTPLYTSVEFGQPVGIGYGQLLEPRPVGYPQVISGQEPAQRQPRTPQNPRGLHTHYTSPTGNLFATNPSPAESNHPVLSCPVEMAQALAQSRRGLVYTPNQQGQQGQQDEIHVHQSQGLLYAPILQSRRSSWIQTSELSRRQPQGQYKSFERNSFQLNPWCTATPGTPDSSATPLSMSSIAYIATPTSDSMPSPYGYGPPSRLSNPVFDYSSAPPPRPSDQAVPDAFGPSPHRVYEAVRSINVAAIDDASAQASQSGLRSQPARARTTVRNYGSNRAGRAPPPNRFVSPTVPILSNKVACSSPVAATSSLQTQAFQRETILQGTQARVPSPTPGPGELISPSLYVSASPTIYGTPTPASRTGFSAMTDISYHTHPAIIAMISEGFPLWAIDTAALLSSASQRPKFTNAQRMIKEGVQATVQCGRCENDDTLCYIWPDYDNGSACARCRVKGHPPCSITIDAKARGLIMERTKKDKKKKRKKKKRGADSDTEFEAAMEATVQENVGERFNLRKTRKFSYAEDSD